MLQPSPDNLTDPRTKNRFLAAVIHINRYAGRFGGLLSKDTGLSTRELRQILRGQREPSYLAVGRIVRALNEHSKVPLPFEELIVDALGSFPTRFICDLFECKCIPPMAYEDDETLNSRFEGVPPGMWEFDVPMFEEIN